MGWFDNLKIDIWFKAVTYLGGVIVILSLTIPMRVLPNEEWSLLGFGLFIFGTGRWKNHKSHSQRVPSGYITWKDRNTDLLGLLLEATGIVLVLLAVWNILKPIILVRSLRLGFFA